MSDCKTCPSSGSCGKTECGENRFSLNPASKIRHIVAVMSGKGGVGKSTVTALLARAMAARGHAVGVMDADITGPSMPRMMNAPTGAIEGEDRGMLPVLSPDGIPVMSIAYFLPEEEKPVIWRGPMLAGAIQQFWSDVFWGELEYLFIDLPPGTGDVTLTVLSSLPISAAVMVATPHDLVGVIVEKAIHMAARLSVPVLGVVENMAYVVCPDCGKKIAFHSEEAIAGVLARHNLPMLARFGMDGALANLAGGALPGGEDGEALAALCSYLEKTFQEKEAAQ